MLRFKKLEITNFGPYQNNQSIIFPDEDGVVLIWGENGFGKTTLMNCIRFALWGKIFDGNNEADSLASYVNYEAVERGESMKIVLHLDYDGESYILTRTLARRPGTDGKKDEDYSTEVYLRKGGSVLGPEECTHFLKTAIPEGISRFYLFDGELLQQYESLLKTGSDNTVIKDSIENILGLPLLENSRDILDIIKGEYSTAFSKASAADSRTRKAAEVYAGLLEKESEIKKSIGDLENLLQDENDELSVIDQRLNDTEVYRGYSSKISECETNIANWSLEYNDYKTDLESLYESLWEAHLKKAINTLVHNKEIKRDNLASQLQEQHQSEALKEILNSIISNHTDNCNCPICNSSLDDSSIQYIKSQLDKLSGEQVDSQQTEYNELVADIRQLRSLVCEDKTSDIRFRLKELSKLDTKIKLEEIKKQRLEKERRNLGQQDGDFSIEDLIPQRDSVVLRIQNLKDGIKEANIALEETRGDLQKVKKQIIKNQANAEVEKAERSLSMCQSIFDIFNGAIEEFKKQLKDAVQKDATDYFVTVSHNPDYKSLSINDQYGLEILTSDGVQVPHRSAGYVQVVALSLIAALHKNAPISGPIIMDSTFQRIDPRHKRNILESLPVLGSQVIVLAYPEEIQADVARNVLKGKLRKEVNLVQESSFKTLIK